MSVTQNQLQMCIKFMDEHPSLANGYKPNSLQGKADLNKLWAELTEILNSNGPPMKNIAGWRKVWTDHKYRAKKKLSQNLLSMQKTGGGPFEEIKITEDEEKIIELTSIRKAVSGLKCPSFGASSPKPSTAITTPSVVSAVAAAAPSTAPSSSNVKINSEDNIKQKDTVDLLNAQMENDLIFQQKLLNILRERNQQDAMFQVKVIEQLQRRNDIAEKQLKKGYF